MEGPVESVREMVVELKLEGLKNGMAYVSISDVTYGGSERY